MSSQFSFAHIKENQFKTLAQYVPIVDRVHGPHHPEFHEVRRLFDVIIEKTKKRGQKSLICSKSLLSCGRLQITIRYLMMSAKLMPRFIRC